MIQPSLSSAATPSSQLPPLSHSRPSSSTASSSLPSVEDILRSPFRSSDIFNSIPGPCLHATVLLLIRLIRKAAARLSPVQMHDAFLRLHILPTAVLRRSFRGEPGWRTQSGQRQALSQRLRRAGSEPECPSSWNEAVDAHKARHLWHVRHSRTRQTKTQPAHRFGRAMRLAAEAQYGRAMKTLSNAPLANLNDPCTHATLSALHPGPRCCRCV